MEDEKKPKKRHPLLRAIFGPSDEEIKKISKEGLKNLREKAGNKLQDSKDEIVKEEIAKEKKSRLEKKLGKRKIKE